jgi:hypothetical protein
VVYKASVGETAIVLARARARNKQTKPRLRGPEACKDFRTYKKQGLPLWPP